VPLYILSQPDELPGLAVFINTVPAPVLTVSSAMFETETVEASPAVSPAALRTVPEVIVCVVNMFAVSKSVLETIVTVPAIPEFSIKVTFPKFNDPLPVITGVAVESIEQLIKFTVFKDVMLREAEDPVKKSPKKILPDAVPEKVTV
jgi:hypothetical protein